MARQLRGDRRGAGLPAAQGRAAGKVWWRNTGAQPHQRAWTGAGWEAAEVDHAGGLVTFRTGGAGSLPRRRLPLADEPAILSASKRTPKWTFALVATGLTIAAGLSVFAIRGWMRRR